MNEIIKKRYLACTCGQILEADFDATAPTKCDQCGSLVQTGSPPARDPAPPIIARPERATGSHICGRCGFVSGPKARVRGDHVTEFLLLCLGIIPGIIYSIWRRSDVGLTCPHCGSQEVIPVNSPRGQKLLRDLAA